MLLNSYNWILNIIQLLIWNNMVDIYRSALDIICHLKEFLGDLW